MGGPGRLPNHDCNPHARLCIRSSQFVDVFAIRDIDVGEEITVSDWDGFFGEGNKDCLCRTCEGLDRGGYVEL